MLGVAFAVAALLSLSFRCIAKLLLARLLRTDTQWRVLNVVLGALLAASVAPMWFE